MLLSRIFSLLLGTTLFVAIWTMQDGNHATPRMGMAVDMRSTSPESPPRPEMADLSSVHPTTAIAVSTVPVPSEQTLWIFADELPEQIAVK